MKIEIKQPGKIKVYILTYYHNKDEPEKKESKIYFPFKPSKYILQKTFQEKKWNADEENWNLTTLRFGKEYKSIITVKEKKVKIEIQCGNCGEKVITQNHCEISPCWNCLTWLYQDGSIVNFEERNKLYEETYFGKDKE